MCRAFSIENIFVHWLLFDAAEFKAETQLAEGEGRRLLVTVEPWTNKQWTVGDRNVMKRVTQATMTARSRPSAAPQVGLRAHPIYVSLRRCRMKATAILGPVGRPSLAGYRHFLATCRPLAPKAAFLWSPVGKLTNLAAYYPGADVVDLCRPTGVLAEQADQDHYGGPQRFADALKEKYDLVIRFAKPGHR